MGLTLKYWSWRVVAASTPSLDDLRIDRSDDRDRVRRWPWVVAVCLLLAVGGGGWWWWIGPARAPEVRTGTARETTGTTEETILNASGYVTARRRATVSSKVTGKLVEVLVEEGMAVRKGQVLARLDSATIRSQLALAEARLGVAQGGFAEQEVRLREAELTLGRTRRLVEEGVVGTADLDGAEAEVDSLKARIALARGQVVVAEREIDVFRTQLDDMVIRAPFDGVAISKDAEAGEMISPVSAGGGFTRTGVSTIVDMGSLEIEVDVNESFINRVQDDQRVVATLDAYPDRDIPAAVITTVPAADRQRATVLVRIGFDELDPRILPDMGIKVAFLEEQSQTLTPETRLVMPAAAARNQDGQDVVYLIRGDLAERRAVRLGSVVGDQAEVIAGLTAGERLIVDGPADLADGDLDVAQGEFLSLMGPSGSGKTTLLNLIGGLDTPSDGSVTVSGERIDRLSGGKLSRWRARHIGFVFQLYNLLPVLTAERNVELPLLLTPLSRTQRKTHVATALAMVDLSDRAKHYPRQLSGGQEQRVGIARAIVTDPTLLLCDEPTGDLDRKSGNEILDLLQALNEEHGKTIVMVTYDARAAARASRTLHLDKGTLVTEGTDA